eukprot:172872-Prorocentrum_minimum.AAC.2
MTGWICAEHRAQKCITNRKKYGFMSHHHTTQYGKRMDLKMPNFHVLTGEPRAGPGLARKQVWRPFKYNKVVPSISKYLRVSEKVTRKAEKVAAKEGGGVKAEGTGPNIVAKHPRHAAVKKPN